MMKIARCEEVDCQPVDMEGASGCHVRWLLGEKDGAPNFAMRQFEVEPGGYTPKHYHPYEHEVYVLEGAGVVHEEVSPQADRPVAGDLDLSHEVAPHVVGKHPLLDQMNYLAALQQVQGSLRPLVVCSTS